ncbi:MAG: SH3 domain-containing protein [Oceanospirillales bacterium]|nr:SH3 domain-containing protein [Oceanospirillales bacterium]MBR9887638.1 SH3 domain-containing protein [Oceanospirillales bacterium]
MKLSVIRSAYLKPRIVQAAGLVLLTLVSPVLLAFDYFVVNRDADIYSAPGGSEVLTRLSKGIVLLEIDKKEPWSKVFFLSPDKQSLKGWMLSESLTSQRQEEHSPLAAGPKLTVAVNSLRLRKGPGVNHVAVGTLRREQQVTELQRDGGWVKVEYRHDSGKVVEAWAAARYFRSSASQMVFRDESVISSSGKTFSLFRVTAANVNLRSGPGSGFPVVGRLSFPQQVEVSEHQKAWRKVRVPGSGDAMSGWMSQHFLEQVR